MLGHPRGAIGVFGALLDLDSCSIEGSRADAGGAIRADGGSHVTLKNSTLTNNSAFATGGALQVYDAFMQDPKSARCHSV
eukprot:6901465-Prymnesium_polylepis.1